MKRDRAGSLDVNLWKEARVPTCRNDSFSDTSYTEYEETWLDRFYEDEGNAWFCEIPDQYLMSDFNMNGLSEVIVNYDDAIDVLRGEADLSEFDNEEELEVSVKCLFYLIHQRYILTEDGLRRMYKKFKTGIYGTCPRKQCKKQHVIAAGSSSSLGQSRCCVFCPRCNDLYYAKEAAMEKVDGAAFGSTFGPLFFRRFQMFLPDEQEIEEPNLQIFGFNLHESRRRRVH